MPAAGAEPAGPPIPPAVNTARDAAVIDITKRRHNSGRASSQAAQGRWTAVNQPPTPGTRPEPGGPPPGPGPDPSRERALTLVANDVETWFNGIDRTLTDDETALIYVHTLTWMQHTLRGAEAQSIIGPDQLSQLQILVDGLKEAPRLA